MKLLSVIIPTYNMEKYLTKCLDSLIVEEKLLKCLEVLIINDGSKDSSSQIAHTYADKYPGVFIVVDKENGNYGSCINRGLKEATGKYTKILDADDHFYTEGLGLFLKHLENLETDLVITDFHIINESGKVTQKCKFGLPKDIELKFEQYCNTSDFYNIQMHAVAYNRNVFKDLNYHQTEGISYTDQEWMFYPMVAVNTFYYLPIAVYKYLLGREGQTMSDKNVERRVAQMEKIVYRAAECLNNTNESDEKKCYLNKRLSSICSSNYKRLLLVDKVEILDKIDNNILQINPVFYHRLIAETLYDSMFGYKYIKGYRTGNRFLFNLMLYLFKFFVRVKSIISIIFYK